MTRHTPWLAAQTLTASIAVLVAAVAFVIAAADNAESATVGQINFGPATATVTGWDQDSGRAYTPARGYGWIAGDGLDRQCFTRSGVSDPLQASVCRADDYYSNGWIESPAIWEHDLPAGDYLVTVAVGDPATSQFQSVTVEGTQVFSSVKNTGGSMLVGTATVTVTDGRLTLEFLPDERTSMLWVTIETTAPPTTTTAPPTTTTAAPPPVGVVEYGPGVHIIDTPIVVETGTVVSGAGRGVTILRPGPNLTGPIIVTPTLTGDGQTDFAIRDFTIDCQNQCDGLRLHGARFTVDMVEIRNAAGAGLWTSWRTGLSTTAVPAMEATISDVLVQQSGNTTTPPVIVDGPHDSTIVGLIVVTHNDGPDRPAAVHVRSNGFGTSFDRLHFWGVGHTDGLVIDAGVTGVRASNSYLEGADGRQVWAKGSNQGTRLEGTRLQCFPPSIGGHGVANIGAQFDGATNSGLIVEAEPLNCEGGGLLLTGGAGELSSFELTAWNSAGPPAVPASARLDHTGT